MSRTTHVLLTALLAHSAISYASSRHKQTLPLGQESHTVALTSEEYQLVLEARRLQEQRDQDFMEASSMAEKERPPFRGSHGISAGIPQQAYQPSAPHAPVQTEEDDDLYEDKAPTPVYEVVNSQRKDGVYVFGNQLFQRLSDNETSYLNEIQKQLQEAIAKSQPTIDLRTIEQKKKHRFIGTCQHLWFHARTFTKSSDEKKTYST